MMGFVALVLLAVQLYGAPAASDFAVKMRPGPVFPAAMTEAKSGRIPLEGIQPSVGTNALVPGDSVTVLVTQHEKRVPPTERLIYLQVVSPTPAEQSVKPAAPAVIYSSLGHKLEFASWPVIVTVRTLGPFDGPGSLRKPAAVQHKSARFALDAGFLGLGLDQVGAAIEAMPGNSDTNHGFCAYGASPFDAAEIARCRKRATTAHFTAEEERACAGAGPALSTYFRTISQTPGLNEILFKTLDLPSVWSWLRKGGLQVGIDLEPDVKALDGAAWGLAAGSPVYSLPMSVTINSHHALDVTLIVTAPRAPLLACGGIIGFLAENPAHKDNYVTVRVVDARQGQDPAGSVLEPQVLAEVSAEPVVSAGAKPPWGRVVMVGASVTAGFTASEPFGGKATARLCLNRYLDAALLAAHEPTRNLANALFFEQPELQGRQQIEEVLRAKPTLVIGIDFLFWFCYGAGLPDNERPARFEKGLKLLEAVQCPLILGDIPDASSATNGLLTADEIPSAQVRLAANQRLKEWAGTRPQVVIVPLSDFLREVTANKGLRIHTSVLADGKTSGLLQEDRLHPNPRGCAVLALAILDAFEAGSSHAAPATDVCWDPTEVFHKGLHEPARYRSRK